MIPHLHCASNFFHLSYGEEKHAYSAREGKVRCNKVEEVWQDPGPFGNFMKIKEIRHAIYKFGKNERSNLNLQLKDEL